MRRGLFALHMERQGRSQLRNRRPAFVRVYHTGANSANSEGAQRLRTEVRCQPVTGGRATLAATGGAAT